MISSPCDAIYGKFGTTMAEFNRSSGLVTGAVNQLNNQLVLMKNEAGIGDMESQLNGLKGQSTSELGGLMSAAGSLIGSCLDGVMGETFGRLNKGNSYTSELFNQINGLTNLSGLLGGLANVKELLDQLGLKELLKKIDSLMGCLADNNECVPVGELDSAMATINGFLDSNGLGTDASFDIDTLLDRVPDMGGLVKNNISMISKSSDEITSTMKDTINTSMQKGKSYYDSTKW